MKTNGSVKKVLLKLRTELVDIHNERITYYEKGKETRRWDGSNPDDRDFHGRECGFIAGIAEAIDAIEKEIDKL